MVVGPIVSQTRLDVFCDNENGPNFLFRNIGDGTFSNVAQQAGVCFCLTVCVSVCVSVCVCVCV